MIPPPLRPDESCAHAYETKGVRCVSVVHAGIAEEPKAKEIKEIGMNTEHAEVRREKGERLVGETLEARGGCSREVTTDANMDFLLCQVHIKY